MEKVFHNCLTVDKTPHGFFPRRFTDRQFARYSSLGEAKTIRARCTASVCMSFETDAPEIWFSYHVKSLSRQHISFDIYENDVFQTTVFIQEAPQDGEVRYTRTGSGKTSGEKTKITIYLPVTGEIYIKEMNFGDFDAVPHKKKKYLALGDSITQGMETFSTSLNYVTLLSRAMDAEVLNQGVGGHVFDAESLDETLDFKPDCITVAYGTNDYTQVRDVSEIEKRIHAYMEKFAAIYKGTPAYFLTPTWRGDIPTEEDAARFRKTSEIISEQAQKHGFDVIDGLTLVPHDPVYFADQRLHPNAKGFELYADNLAKTMLNKNN